MSFFNKNLDLLKKHMPELAAKVEETDVSEDITIDISRDGLPVLKINKMHFHSPYNPIADAKNWVKKNTQGIDNQPVVLLGLGFGYHVLELIKECKAEIFVIEPRIDVLKTAFEHIDFAEILDKTRLFVGEDINSLFQYAPFKDLISGEKNDIHIMNHNPSLRVNLEYFEGFLAKYEALKNSSTIKLNIMVISPMCGGSYPISRYCVDALKNLGHQVDFVDNSPYYQTFKSLEDITDDKSRVAQLRNSYISLMSEAVFTRAEKLKPDLILALAQSPLTADILERLKALNTLVAYWFVEDFKEMVYWERIAPQCDFFFTIQRGEFFEELKKKGISNYAYLPLACDPLVHKKVFLSNDDRKKYECDISFMGAGYYNRRNSFSRLIDFDLKIWGTEWDLHSPLGRFIQDEGRRLEPEEYNKIFNASKINLNLHSSTYHKGVNPFGDFVNPRTFEIASAGGFQLVDHRSELSQLFEIGKEVVCYKDIDDLREKVIYYLEHSEERERIAANGQKRVLEKHNYENRMKEMIASVLERAPHLLMKENSSSINCVKNLIDEAGQNTELEEFLLRFETEEEIELDEIIKEINKGEGDLSRVESIFLLMKSFAE